VFSRYFLIFLRKSHVSLKIFSRNGYSKYFFTHQHHEEIFMDLERLYEFIIIAENGSISKAASLLQVAPATLHARLKRFESDLDVALFDRTSGALTLTQNGQSLYHNGRALAQLYRGLSQKLQTVSSVAYQQIRIGIAGNIMPPHLGPFLDIINRDYPDVEISLMGGHQVNIDDDLRSGAVDVYFAPVMQHVFYEGIHKQALSSPHTAVVMPRSHPLSQRQSLSLKELGGASFLLFPQAKEPCLRQFQLENLEAAGIPYHIVDSDTDPAFLRFLVPVGKGLLLSPLYESEAAPNSVLLPVDDLPHPASDSILYLKKPFRDETTHFVNDFLKFAKESSHEHRPII
jgi:DNA-binding transcriptional LysR family regulator